MLKLFFLIDKYLLIDLLYHFISNIIKFSVKITDNSGVGNRESDYSSQNKLFDLLKKLEFGEYFILGNYKVVK